MRAARMCMSVCLLLGCGAAQPTLKGLPLDPAEQADITRIETIGSTLFRMIHLGTTAQDLLQREIDSAEQTALDDWLAVDRGDNTIVHFYTDSESQVTVLADVTFSPEHKPQVSLTPDRPVESDELAMVKAHQTGLNAGVNKCAEQFNAVVLGDPQTDYQVYILATAEDEEKIPIGGHSKVTVSADGQTVLSHEPYAKSCLVLDTTPQKLPLKADIEGLFVTHIISPYPAPTHVFLSMLHEQPLYVGTEIGIWLISEGNISLVERRP